MCTLHSGIARRFESNDKQLRYQLLHREWYVCTSCQQLHLPVVVCVQSALQMKGWTRVHPCHTNRVHVRLYPFCSKRYGVPPVMIWDNAEAQVKSMFRKKCVNVRVCLECTEPCSLEQNADDMVSEDLKRTVKWH